MNEEINKWLFSERNYDAGVSLYEKFGVSATLKRILRVGGFTQKNAQTLLYELNKINKAVQVKPIQVKRIIKPPVIPVIKMELKKNTPAADLLQPKIIDPGRRTNTPEVDQLNLYKKSLLKERDYLHANLEYVSDKQRKIDGDRIIKLSDEIGEIYDRLDHFNKHGILIPGSYDKESAKKSRKTVNDMDIPEIIRRQTTLRTYISKYDKKLKAAKGPDVIMKFQKLLDKYHQELEDINKKLAK